MTNEEKIVKIRVVRDDNKEFVLDGGDFRIPSNGLSGFGSLDNTISTVSNAVGDGDQITSERLSSKDRTVKAYVRDTRYNVQLRNAAKRFFIYKHTYKLYATYMGETYWCEGRLVKKAISEGNIYDRVWIQFTILCPNPFWKSNSNFGKNIASVIPMHAFPYLSTAENGRATGVYSYDREVRIFNDGDVATKVKAVFRATGDVTNPKLIVNNKYVRILTTMVATDELIIDFTPQVAKVTLNGVNIIGATDRKSDLTEMEIAIGDNIIGYAADTGDTNMDVSIYYNTLYELL